MKAVSRGLIAIAALVFGAAALAQTVELPAEPVSVTRTADGTEVRQYDIRVTRVSRNHITVRFDNGQTATYRVPRDFMFMIEGQPTPLSGISPRQQLRVYVERKDEQWRLAQAQPDEAGVMEVVVSAPEVSETVYEAEEPAPALPATASNLPALALGGGLLLLLGLFLQAGSRRFSRN